MKHLIRFLVLAFALAIPSIAFAQNNPRKTIGPSGGGITAHNVATDLRTRTYHLGAVMLPGDGDVTAGIDGVVAKVDLYASSVELVTFSQTTSIAALPYPAKLSVDLIDGGAGSGALTCTSITIRGNDQFGNSISETVSTLTETAQQTVRVYESVSAISGVGCDIASDGDTSDDLQLAVSSEVGLPFDIRAVDAIIAVCITESYAAGETQCWRGGASDSAILFDNAGSGNRVDLVYDSIELGGGKGGGTDLTGNTLADGQELKFYLRAPGGAR